MARFRVGVQLHPQATTVDEMRAAWKAADALGVDSIWTWDHFYPLYGDPDAAHFHDHADVGQWLLVAQQATYAGNGRVFGSGAVFAQDGTLVSTYAQDSMARGVEGTIDPKRGM